MKKMAQVAFPVFFAGFAFFAFWIIGRFGPGSRKPVVGALVFFAALGWSTMTWFRERKYRILKFILVATAVAGSIAAVELFAAAEGGLAQYRIAYALIILGILSIQIYSVTEKKKGQQ